MSSYECDIHVNFDVGVLNWLTTWFCEAFKSIIPGVICNVSKSLWFCTTWTIIGVVLWNLLCFLKRWYFPSSTSAKKSVFDSFSFALETVWKVMEMCYKILGEGKLVTLRELFYTLLSESPTYFTCQRHVNQTVQGPRISEFWLHFFLSVSLTWCLIMFVLCSCADVVSLLRCTRQSLGIMASSRGALIGRLVLQVCLIPCYDEWNMCCILIASLVYLAAAAWTCV